MHSDAIAGNAPNGDEMATRLAVAQQKCGSCTAARTAKLPIACAEDKKTVAVADIDPQRSLTLWPALHSKLHGGGSGITVAEIAGWKLATELDRLRARKNLHVDSQRKQP